MKEIKTVKDFKDWIQDWLKAYGLAVVIALAVFGYFAKWY